MNKDQKLGCSWKPGNVRDMSLMNICLTLSVLRQYWQRASRRGSNRSPPPPSSASAIATVSLDFLSSHSTSSAVHLNWELAFNHRRHVYCLLSRVDWKTCVYVTQTLCLKQTAKQYSKSFTHRKHQVLHQLSERYSSMFRIQVVPKRLWMWDHRQYLCDYSRVQ